MIAALLLVLMPQAALAGMYEARQMEVAAALALRQDGHFSYALDYGAISEAASGDWVLDGGTVRLTTRPAPHRPTFELVRDDPAPAGQITITVEPPGVGAQGHRLDAIATDAVTGERGMVSTDDKGSLDAGKRRVSAIEPLIPVYGTVGGHFALAPGRGHHLLLRFRARDIGKAAFDREPLALTPGPLVLKRYGTEIRFIRVGP